MSVTNIPMPREQLERVVRQIVRQRYAEALLGGEMQQAMAYEPNQVVNISARHMHVSQQDLETLFGPGSQLTVYRWLYQPGEFASEQRVAIKGPRGRVIDNVRILGPVRKESQIEVSFTDSIALGMDIPVRPSGKTDGTPGCEIIGPAGSIKMPQGVIRAERHVHMSPADAETYGFTNGQYVKLHVESDCATTYEKVLCRVDPKFLFEVHLDTDEGNACNLVDATGVGMMA